MRIFTLAELEGMATISQSQMDDLKIEMTMNDGREYRVWLSRMTVEDGMPYDNQVTVEKYIKSEGTKAHPAFSWKWETIKQYQAK